MWVATLSKFNSSNFFRSLKEIRFVTKKHLPRIATLHYIRNHCDAIHLSPNGYSMRHNCNFFVRISSQILLSHGKSYPQSCSLVFINKLFFCTASSFALGRTAAEMTPGPSQPPTCRESVSLDLITATYSGTDSNRVSGYVSIPGFFRLCMCSLSVPCVRGQALSCRGHFGAAAPKLCCVQKFFSNI